MAAHHIKKHKNVGFEPVLTQILNINLMFFHSVKYLCRDCGGIVPCFAGIFCGFSLLDFVFFFPSTNSFASFIQKSHY